MIRLARILVSVCGVGLVAGSSASASDAIVRLNEVNANIANGCDLVELRVLSNGSMDGFQLWQRTTPMLTFSGLTVRTNDFVVVHINSGSVACRPPGLGNETNSPNQFPLASFPTNFDGAYDWYSADASIVSTTNVLTLYGSAGNIVDSVLLADDVSGTVAAAAETQAAAVAAAGQWQQVGGGVPAGGFVGADFRANAALDLNATGTSSSGATIQRVDNLDHDTKADWAMVATPTWGQLNAGQSPLGVTGVPVAGSLGRVTLAISLIVVAGAAALRRARRRRG
jgi:hypothetical protein